jgi:hypothetical protein
MKFGVARTVGGAWTLVRSFTRYFVLLLAMASYSSADTLYKYRGQNGEWIYTDRKPPAETKVETRAFELSFVQPEFSVTSEVIGKEVEFVAHNDYHAPIEVRLEFIEITGIEYPDSDERLRWVVEPRSDLLLLNLSILQGSAAPKVRFQFEYMPGDPSAQHQADIGYQAPFSAGRTFRISQTYPDTITHATRDNSFAVDIEMPIGTDILAARGGVVFEVASQNYRNGLDPIENGRDANIVRILHDDGTFSLYAHLNWNSIRVKPGDRVRTGQYIADSGNTGFSSGPHLHFAVQKNAGLQVQSLPVTFKGPTAAKVVPLTGNQLTGYP